MNQTEFKLHSRYSCDITNDIHWGNDKMPTYDSINKEALDLLGDVLNQIAKKK